MRASILIGMAIFITAPMVAQAQIVVRVPTTQAEKQKLDAFVHGRELSKINDYASPNLDSIGPIENIIFRKAVLLGGLNARFEDVIVPNSARARYEIAAGVSVVGGGTAHWHTHYQENAEKLYESAVVIPQGSYYKGLYTTYDKAGKLKIGKLADLGNLSAVTSVAWLVDWASLEKLPLKALYSVSTRAGQFRIVQHERADFTLQDFSATADMSIEEQGVRLYPIHGVKIVLNGTRHFFVSKKHPDGAKVFESLQKGLKVMQQSGEINRILLESGFLNKKVKDWIVLNNQTP